MRLVKVLFFVLVLVLVFYGCGDSHKKRADSAKPENNELIIYCENAIAPLIYELKKQFEQKYNCKVIIQNDCAQNLIGLINYSHKGDLFIPSSKHSFNILRKKTKEEITDSVFLGYNRLVFMVKKGNPKDFSGELSTLTSKEFSLIIANPETSSLGYETRKVLIESNIYDEVLKNIVSLTTDSKGLIKSLKNNQADLVINFASTIHNNGNVNYIDVIPFSPNHQSVSEVYAGVLSTSKNRELAQSFLAYVNNSESKSVLNRYGLSKRKTFIF